MSERLWKVLGPDRVSLIAGTGYRYPTEGWTRHLNPRRLELCAYGYHYCQGPQVLEWLNEGLLCEVESCQEHEPLSREDKNASCRLRIVQTWLLTSRILRLFAADCAERALLRERNADREPDPRSWEAVGVARRFADGNATAAQLVAARNAAGVAARVAAWYAAWYAAGDAAGDAARDAARDAERRWQYERLLELVGAENE